MSGSTFSVEESRARFAAGAWLPSDALAACKARVDERNGALNAIVHADWERAERAAQESDARWRAGAPLSQIDGAPIAVKANCAIAGLPWTAALQPFARQIAEADSHVVSLLRAAGAVIVGLTNMHEAALGATTTSPLYGPCINPLLDGHTPGGSSGGSAAAVAAGFCAAAIGTDTMGSVRIPSAYCGIVGFKPSYGRISTRGLIPLAHTLDHVGVHANTIVDIEALFAICAGFDAADAYAEDIADEPRASAAERLRFGVVHTKVALDAPVQAAFDGAIAALRSQGVALIDIDFTPVDFSAMRRRGLLIAEAELLAAYPDLAAESALLSPELARALAWGARQTAPRLAEAYARRAEANVLARDAFARADILLMPTAPQLAFPHAQAAPETQADLTVLANFARLPAACVPIATGGAGGLPASLQIIGPANADARVLAAAAFVEKVLVS